jgi:enamine deaminase RidA (YjgF/YER057c/UK114 family)
MASDSNPPAHSRIGVSGLGIKDQVVEIACIAVLPDE